MTHNTPNERNVAQSAAAGFADVKAKLGLSQTREAELEGQVNRLKQDVRLHHSIFFFGGGEGGFTASRFKIYFLGKEKGGTHFSICFAPRFFEIVMLLFVNDPLFRCFSPLAARFWCMIMNADVDFSAYILCAIAWFGVVDCVVLTLSATCIMCLGPIHFSESKSG